MKKRHGPFSDDDLFPFRSMIHPNNICLAIYLVYIVTSLIERISDTIKYRKSERDLSERLLRRRALQVIRRDLAWFSLSGEMGWTPAEIDAAERIRDTTTRGFIGTGAYEELRIRKLLLPKVSSKRPALGYARDLREELLGYLGYRGSPDQVRRFQSGVRRWRKPVDVYIVDKEEDDTVQSQTREEGLPNWLALLDIRLQNLLVADFWKKRDVFKENQQFYLGGGVEEQLRALAATTPEEDRKAGLTWHADMIRVCKEEGVETAFDRWEKGIVMKGLPQILERCMDRPNWFECRDFAEREHFVISSDELQAALDGAIFFLEGKLLEISRRKDAPEKIEEALFEKIQNLKSHKAFFLDCRAENASEALYNRMFRDKITVSSYKEGK